MYQPKVEGRKYGKSEFRERSDGVIEKTCTKCEPKRWYPYTEDVFGFDSGKGLRTACCWCRAKEARERRKRRKIDYD